MDCDAAINIPLVTQNNDPTSFAIIGQPGTQIIFGSGADDRHFDLSRLNGARWILGGWIDPACQFGIEGSGSSFAKEEAEFTASSVLTNSPAINVPFFSVTTASENVLVAARPNIVINQDSFRSSSFEVNGLYRMNNPGPFPLILSAGFRNINLYEKLTLTDSVYTIPFLPPNSALNVQDSFSAKTQFYGFQLGARTNFSYCDFLFEAKGEMAFGRNNQTLNIAGQTNVDNQTLIQPIGLFAEPSNIGTFKRNQFTIVPELELKLGYDDIKYIHPFVTYDVMYLSHVLRPSENLDRNVNTSQNVLLGGTGILTGTPAPLANLHSTSIWMQGVSVGIEFSWD